MTIKAMTDLYPQVTQTSPEHGVNLHITPKTDAEWLTNLLSLMGYEISVSDRLEDLTALDSTVTVSDQNHWLDINSEGLQESQIQNLIGKDGSVLDAIQYLTNVSLNRYRELANQDAIPNFYTVEIAGYRTQYLRNLQDLANQAVQQVRDTQEEYVIKQLSAADRRYIHQLLEGDLDIQTYSQGKEPNRHLVVKLKSLS